MSLSLYFDWLRAVRHGKKDARSALSESQGPNPYFDYLAREGRRRASVIERRFWQEDRHFEHRWIDAENRQHQAELELPRLQRELVSAQAARDTERARDEAETVELNPPGRAYIPVLLHWLLLALLIGGDAAISYSAFLTIGDVTPWLVGALSLMVVVAMVVIGHVIGDRLRHGTAGRWTVVGLVAVVLAISVVMTIYREQAQAEALEATRSSQIEVVSLTGETQPVTPSEPVQLVFNPAQLPAFFMFLTVTMMGIVVPAILAYYVERRPRLLKAVEASWAARRAAARLGAGRRRFYQANRRVAASRADRANRHRQACARLDESRDDMYWLMSVYADANMRRRSSQELPPGLLEKPPVPGREILGELDWSYPTAHRGETYWGKTPGQL